MLLFGKTEKKCGQKGFVQMGIFFVQTRHLLINNEKMSKSTGNFLTLSESIGKFSADATRFALAVAGDSVEDANFEMDQANSIILRLATFKEWLENLPNMKQYSGSTYRFVDLAFENDTSRLVELAEKAFDNMLYYDAMKFGFHELMNARDRYIAVCNVEQIGIHLPLIEKWIEVFCIVTSPVIPHFTDYVYRNILKKPHSILKASWPVLKKYDASIVDAKNYIDNLLHSARVTLDQELNPKKKKPNDTKKSFKSVVLNCSSGFPEWQEATITVLKEEYNVSLSLIFRRRKVWMSNLLYLLYLKIQEHNPF